MTTESVLLEYAWINIQYADMDMHEFVTAYADAAERARSVGAELPGIEDAASDFYYKGHIYI
jgi:hypothetical protein